MNGLTSKKINSYLLLNCAWAGLSLLLLILVLYFTWQRETITIRHLLYTLGDEVADKFDEFLENTANNATSFNLGLLGKSCTPQLKNQLSSIIFNNPTISGIEIRDQNGNLFCGTVPYGKFLGKSTGRTSLYGPLTVPESPEKIYILQERLGDFFVNVYLLESVLLKYLQTDDNLAEHIALYSDQQDKIFLEISRKKNDRWKVEHIANQEIWQSSDKQQSHTPLNYLDNFQIVLVADVNRIHQITWKQELLTSVLVVLFFFIIYFALRTIINRHFSLNRAVMVAIRKGNFFPMYQPVLNTKLDKCVGAEVLLRWQLSEQEIVTPDYFIKEVEESGLILPITLYLIERTLAECKELLDNYPDFHLAFNLSSVHFMENQFFEKLLAICKRYAISPSQIMLEITERNLLKQDDLMIVKLMKELRQAGFSLAVDDFGTGHASISYLQHFPFNFLKIDQLFVRAIGTGAITETLNNSIIHMAQNLKLNIIAEGVETLAQLDYLSSQGVNLMQGWYFARALPHSELVQFVTGVRHE